MTKKLNPNVFLKAAERVFLQKDCYCCWAILNAQNTTRTVLPDFGKGDIYQTFFESLFPNQTIAGQCWEFNPSYIRHWLHRDEWAYEERVLALLFCYWECQR